MASTSSGLSATASPVSARPTYSCVRCIDRKVKCDRQRPCSACVKHSVNCIYSTSQPPRKRQRRAKDQVLEDRLRYYEALLKHEGIDPTKLPDTSELEPKPLSKPSQEGVPKERIVSQNSGAKTAVNKTETVRGNLQSQFVHNLYMRVVEELQAADADLEDVLIDLSNQEASDDEFGFILPSPPRSATIPRYPPPETIHELWQIFRENVDPLTKIIHVPSLQPAITKAAINIEVIPRNFGALLFAICGAAIMSLSDEDCQKRFQEPQKAMLSHFLSQTKAALSRANFLGTTSIIVLQALVLHLLTVRDIYEPRAVLSLTGLAVRIAEGMSLDRDGAFLGLPMFESEMRRRIWWLLKTHDFRTAELCGLPKFRDLNTGHASTKWPSNVNDDQLYSGMTSLVAASDGLTDVAFLVMRYEITNFAAGRVNDFRQQGKGPDQWDLQASASDKGKTDEALRDLEKLLETKYLRYCDPSQPLHLMTMLIARFSLNIIRFLGHHPRRWASIEQTPVSERQWVWEISMKLLEQHSMVQTNPLLKRFAWHAQYFQQWHAFLHVLDVLRHDPLVASADRAWELIGNIYENTPDMILDMRKPIHVAVGNLCLKAYGSRESAAEIKKERTPGFIARLRHQIDVLRAKLQARDSNKKQAEHAVGQNQSNALDVCLISGSEVHSQSDALESSGLQKGTTISSPGLDHSEKVTGSDQFWLINGFDDGQTGDMDNLMSMDLDLMLTRGETLEDGTSQNVTWEQWDAWLAESNLLRPVSSTWDVDFSSGC